MVGFNEWSLILGGGILQSVSVDEHSCTTSTVLFLLPADDDHKSLQAETHVKPLFVGNSLCCQIYL